MRTWELSQLDELMEYFKEGYTVSHDEAYRRFYENGMAPPADLPADPFSEDYRDRQLSIYKSLALKDYQVENEHAGLDIEESLKRPFPFFTRSAKMAAGHFGLISKLLEVLDVPDGATILDCGMGQGNTSLILSMLGHKVTALDVEANYCELVRRRAEMHSTEIEILHADYLWMETADRQFDAIIFFESFHHCWEFDRVLKAIPRLLKPDGKVYFAAEPVIDNYPYPWGIRLDGEPLWVARNFGWMELGFSSEFFEELLRRSGFWGECVHPGFWVASTKPVTRSYDVKGGRLHTQLGTREESEITFDAQSDGYVVFGPYIQLGRGAYTAQIDGDLDGESIIDVCCEGGRVIAQSANAMAIDFELAQAAVHLEVRLFVRQGSSGTVRSITFKKH